MQATHEQHIEYLHQELRQLRQRVEDLERKQAELIASVFITKEQRDIPLKRGPGRPRKDEQEARDQVVQ